jgi:AcrR family transcriptional regulator
MRQADSKEIRPKNRIRMSPDDRRNLILSEAINFFAEFGFGGGTRDLAEKIGIKQPLLYRYFSSKEQLVREVYTTVCSRQFRENWRYQLEDNSRNIRDRFTAFYKEFLSAAFHPTATRIFLYSGLARLDESKDFTRFVELEIFVELAKQMRAHLGLQSLAEVPLHEEEQMVLWIYHGGICFHRIQMEVFPNPDSSLGLDRFIELSVEGLMKSFPHIGKK